MTTTFTITETKKHSGANWVEGYIGEYHYQALVFPCGSKFGIDDGNISKLWICHQTTRKMVVNYDRGWDIEPTDENIKEMVDAIVDYYYAE